MPSLLDVLPANDLKNYRRLSPVQPLVIAFSSGSIRSGVFCCLVVHLIKQCGWRIVHMEGKPEVIAQNCIILSHPTTPCIIALIDSFSCIEVHVQDADFFICKRICPSILEDILSGLTESCRVLSYSYEQPEMRFFCNCRSQDRPPSSLSSTPANEMDTSHVARLLKNQVWAQCTIRERKYWKVTPEHRVWFSNYGKFCLMFTLWNNNTLIVLQVNFHLRQFSMSIPTYFR